jgi:multiple sugar transport system permease protein
MVRPRAGLGLWRVLVLVILLGALLFYLFPILWMLATSLKAPGDVFAMPPKHLFKPTLLNYRNVFVAKGQLAGATEFPSRLANSIIIGTISTILAVLLGTLAAYAFSRFPMKGKADLLFFILSTRMLPPIAIVIPVFLMYRDWGLRDTHLGMIFLYTVFNMAFAVWMMKGFIDEIPADYEEAAMCDGYSRARAFFKVVLPQAIPAMAATAVFCLITAWNEFAFALVLTGANARTAPPEIVGKIRPEGIQWGEVSASGFVMLLPVLVFTFLVRNHLLRGVTFGAVRR